MRARRIVVGVWLAALSACIWQVMHTRFVADLSAFLPAAPTAAQRFLVDQLRDGALSRVMLIGIDGADAPARAAISRALVRSLGTNPLFTSASNGESAGFEREEALLLAHRYALSPAVTPERFTVDGLRTAIDATLDLLASSAGLIAKALVPRDPTGELLAVVDRMRTSAAPRSVDGVWASADGDRAVLIARTHAGGSDIDAQARAIAAVEQAFAAGSAPFADKHPALRLTGAGVFSARSRAMIIHDVERLAVASALVVATLLLVAYRSVAALALGFIPVGCGALAGITAVALGFGAVHGITLGFGTTLIGEAVDYSIYLFIQAGRESTAGGRDWVAGFWPTIRLGVLTSIVGFSALLLSGLPGLAQLGLYSIVGLIVAAAVTRFVLPSLLPAGFATRDLSRLGARLTRIVARSTRLRWLVPALALAAVITLVVHRDRLWDGELTALNPIPVADRALDASLRAALGAPDARLTIAAGGASADAALANAEAIGRRLDALVAAGKLAGYESPANLLPSVGTQRMRLASLPDSDTLRTRLAAALAGSPLRPDKLEPFVDDVAKARDAAPLTRDDVKGTALDLALEGLLFADSGGRWTALIGLRPPAGAPIDAIAIRAALAGSHDAVVLDIKTEVDRLYGGYLQRAQRMSALGLAAIVVLLALALRSSARLARALVPLAAAVLVAAALHSLAGTRLSLLHLVGLLLVVAIGSNYVLFFDRIDRPHVLRTTAAHATLASLALANVTTVASFGILAWSDIPVLNAIGSTAAIGAFCTLAFAAMLSRPPDAHDRRDEPAV